MTLADLDLLAERDVAAVAQEYGLKAAWLARMHQLGLPVPRAVFSPVGDESFDPREWSRALEGLRAPYSVRSGGRTSMPGLMRTVLNVGLDDLVADGLVTRGMEESVVDEMRRHLSVELGAAAELPAVECVERAFRAVHASRPSGKAATYRRILQGDPGGTGVVVQEMRFGNLDSASGSGVVFSHDPVTGASDTVVDFALGRQGTAAVEGSVDVSGLDDLLVRFPRASTELLAALDVLVAEVGGPVDVEFTVEAGSLYLLQCRPAAVAPPSVDDGVVHTVDDADALAVGVPASLGTGSGLLVHADQVTSDLIRSRPGDLVLLCETADLRFVRDVQLLAGIVVVRGGPLCHLALVARSTRVPCLVAVDDAGADTLRGHVGSYVLVDGPGGAVLDACVGPFATASSHSSAGLVEHGFHSPAQRSTT